MTVFVFVLLALSVGIPRGARGDSPCPAGRFTDASVNQEPLCSPCNPGRYAPVSGMPTCIPCPPGSFSAQYASSACASCSPGFYQPVLGSSGCRACPSQTVQPNAGSTYCRACPLGWWTPNATIACAPCPAGTMAAPADSGLGRCVPCPIGRYAAEEASVECTACPYNTYAGALGTPACTACAPGFFTDAPESINVDRCMNCLVEFNLTWPATPPRNPIAWLTCAPYLCESPNSLARELCRQWEPTEVPLLERTCAMFSCPLATNNTDLWRSLVLGDAKTAMQDVWTSAALASVMTFTIIGDLCAIACFMIMFVNMCRNMRKTAPHHVIENETPSVVKPSIEDEDEATLENVVANARAVRYARTIGTIDEDDELRPVRTPQTDDEDQDVLLTAARRYATLPLPPRRPTASITTTTWHAPSLCPEDAHTHHAGGGQ